jgi:hypothetical protein
MRTSHAVILSRLQFSFTISFHIIFPAFTIGIAAWLTVLEALHLKTGRPAYRVLFEFWLKTFGVAFGLGVVSRENGARAAILGSGALLGESQFSVSARPRFLYG